MKTRFDRSSHVGTATAVGEKPHPNGSLQLYWERLGMLDVSPSARLDGT